MEKAFKVNDLENLFYYLRVTKGMYEISFINSIILGFREDSKHKWKYELITSLLEEMHNYITSQQQKGNIIYD